MSIFSSIGHVISTGVHDVGSLFGGGNNNNNATTTTTTQNIQKINQQVQNQAKNGVSNATLPNNGVNLSQLGAGQLQKVQPAVNNAVVTTTTTIVPQKPTSLLDKIGTGIKDVGEGAAGTALGVLRTGEGLVGGAAQLPNDAVHVATFVPRQIVGNNSGVGQALNDENKVVNSATNTITAPLTGLEKFTDQGAAAYGPGAEATYKPAQVAANIATVIPGAVAVASKIPQLAEGLESTNAALDAQRGVNTLEKVPVVGPLLNKIPGIGVKAEVADGVTSTNPNQVEDAVQQTNDKIQQNTPQIEQPAPDQITTPQPVETSTSEPVNVNKNVNPVETAPAVVAPEAPIVDQPTQQPDLTGKTVETPQQPQIAPSGDELQNTQTQETVPTTPQLPANPVETSSLPENVSQDAQSVNTDTGRTAPNAPNLRPQLEQSLKEAGMKAGTSTEHDVLSNPELRNAADRVVANTPDSEILSRYSGVPNLSDPADLAHGDSSMARLADISRQARAAGNVDTDVAAKQAIDNILEGSEKSVSKAGRTMNYTQSMYDSLPKEAKISSTIRAIDKARISADADLPKISSDPVERAKVEANIDSLLTKGEALKTQVTANEGKIQQLHEDANNGKIAPKDAVKQIQQIDKESDGLELQQSAQNGATARYYNSLMPEKAGLQKAANLARTGMLTSPASRLNNLANVGFNSGYETLRSVLQAPLNRVVNRVAGNGTTADSTLLNRGLVKGALKGSKQFVSEFRGNAHIDDLKQATKNGTTGKTFDLAQTADNRGLNKVVNATHALVKAPSEIIGGALKEAQITRLAKQEGQAAGLVGDDLKVYTAAKSAVPTKSMISNAELLQDQVSHMNKNPFADTVGKLLGSDPTTTSNIQGATAILKNTFLPFPKYAATFAWNTLTDRNVIADTVRGAKAIQQGNPEDFTRALSGFAVDGTAMAVGYHLAKQGLITNKDANGYSDDGFYLHLGDRYIPLGFFGVNAEPLIAGSAMQSAMSSKNANPLDVFTKTVSDTILDTLKTAGAQSIVGADDPALTSIQNAVTGKEGVTSGDAAASLGSQVAGQFIPGAFSDVNAALNQTNLDPTHEAALTKVTKGSKGILTADGNPSTGTDVKPTLINSLKNRIPFVSQTLPRNTAIASTDLFDRVTRGSHTGPLQVANQAATAANLSKTQTDLKTGIPVYKPVKGTTPKGYSFANVLNNDAQTGHYQKAAQGAQAELNAMNSSQTVIPPSKKTPVQNRIKQLSVLAQNKVPVSLMNQYGTTTVTEWRKMGDSSSASYDPTTYNALYNLDQALASKGVAEGSLTTAGDKTTGKYTLTKSESGGSSSGSSGSSSVKGNTVGSTPDLGTISFSNLTPKAISNATLPTIAKLTPTQLSKKRAISVTPV